MTDPRPVGWWGMLLTVMVVATTYAAMYFTYVYLRVSSAQWPPEGIPPPDLWAAGLSALAASGLAIRLASQAPLPGLTAAIGLAAAHAWLLVDDWSQRGFDPTVHAYGSASVVLPAVHLTFVGIGGIMAGVLLALTTRGPTREHHVGMRSLALWWWATVVGGLVLLALVYGTPHVWSEPWPFP